MTDDAAIAARDALAPLVLRPTVVPYLLAPLVAAPVWLFGAVLAEGLGLLVPWSVAVGLALVGLSSRIRRMRFVVDADGVARRGLVGGERRLTWAAIEAYHYAGSAVRSGVMPGGAGAVALDLLLRSHGGSARIRHELRVHGGASTLKLTSTFAHADRAVARILGELHPRLRGGPPERLVRFGPITLGDEAIALEGKPPLPRGDLETIQVMGGSRPRLRVMKHGKVLPWASYRLDAIPNAMLLLEEAVERGIPCAIDDDVAISTSLAERLATRAALPAARVHRRE